MSKKKVGIIRLYCGDSGQPQYYNMQELGLAKEYVKNNYMVYIIILKKGNFKKTYQRVEKNIVFIFPQTFNVLNHGIFSIKIIRELQLDLIHLNSDNQLFVPIILNYCKRNSIEVYNYVGMIFSGAGNKLKKALADVAAWVNIYYYRKFPTIAKTDAVKMEMEKCNIKNAEVVPVGLDVDDICLSNESKEVFKKRFHLPLNKKIILFIGRMQEEKSPLEALDLLESLTEDYIMVMIGEGKLSQKIDERIIKRNLDGRVYRIHKVMNREIYQYYQCADYFINLNRNELFGMCILEAMYSGCIVIAVRAPGPNMILTDKVTGFLADNINDIKLILEGHIENSDKIKQLAYEEVCNNYLWEKSYKKIEEYRKKYRLS
ncbi:MAG: glycosyltransferase [Ruminococcus sp.]|nr:glycosyltransferase [Ruminococcus sp.]